MRSRGILPGTSCGAGRSAELVERGRNKVSYITSNNMYDIVMTTGIKRPSKIFLITDQFFTLKIPYESYKKLP